MHATARVHHQSFLGATGLTVEPHVAPSSARAVLPSKVGSIYPASKERRLEAHLISDGQGEQGNAVRLQPQLQHRRHHCSMGLLQPGATSAYGAPGLSSVHAERCSSFSCHACCSAQQIRKQLDSQERMGLQCDFSSGTHIVNHELPRHMLTTGECRRAGPTSYRMSEPSMTSNMALSWISGMCVRFSGLVQTMLAAWQAPVWECSLLRSECQSMKHTCMFACRLPCTCALSNQGGIKLAGCLILLQHQSCCLTLCSSVGVHGAGSQASWLTLALHITLHTAPPSKRWAHQIPARS